MNKVISWLPSLFLRQVLKVCLVLFTVVAIGTFGYSNLLQAQAEPVTPEATSYQANGTDSVKLKNDNKLGEKSTNPLKEAAENIKEKLNLDEPIDPGTKDFLNSVEKNVEKTVKPVTGNEKGYYQDNELAR